MNSTTSYWEILGLAPGSASEREVKTAYARLIKLHRPDQDPVGFTRINDAFNVIIAELRGDPRPQTSSSAASQAPAPPPQAPPAPALPKPPQRPPSFNTKWSEQDQSPVPKPAPVPAPIPKPAPVPVPVPKPTPVPAPIPKPEPSPLAPAVTAATHIPSDEPAAAALEDLRQSLPTKARQKIRIAWEHYETQATAAGVSASRRLQRVLEIFGQEELLLGEVVTDERLIAALKLGDSHLARIVAATFSRIGDTRRMEDFFVSYNRARLTLLDEGGAVGLCLLAQAMGAWAPSNANRLAQKAFPSLPVELRRQLSANVDREVALGNAVERLPHDSKVFWLATLRGQNLEQNWRDTTAVQHLAAALSLYGTKWAALPILHELLPKANWDALLATAQALLR